MEWSWSWVIPELTTRSNGMTTCRRARRRRSRYFGFTPPAAGECATEMIRLPTRACRRGGCSLNTVQHHVRAEYQPVLRSCSSYRGETRSWPFWIWKLYPVIAPFLFRFRLPVKRVWRQQETFFRIRKTKKWNTGRHWESVWQLVWVILVSSKKIKKRDMDRGWIYNFNLFRIMDCSRWALSTSQETGCNWTRVTISHWLMSPHIKSQSSCGVKLNNKSIWPHSFPLSITNNYDIKCSSN